jgi:hypothetical protein
MLNVEKFKNGANSSAAGSNRRGGQGRLELEATKAMVDGQETFNVVFRDFGNYGRQRWVANFGSLSQVQVQEMIGHLQGLLVDDELDGPILEVGSNS